MTVLPEPGAAGPLPLLREITHCPVVEYCKAGAVHPCAKVVAVQGDQPLSSHQVPEPWTGHLDEAVVLFISSNPSISESEHYPTWDDSPGDTGQYFTDRFGGRPGQIKDGIYPPLKAGGWGSHVRFWASVRGRARELLDDPLPGTDYALTEVVHCKSRDEQGVANARDFCADRYLRRILQLAERVALVVLYGQHARIGFANVFGVHVEPDHPHAVTELSPARRVHVVALDHPSGRGKIKRLMTALPPETLTQVKAAVTQARADRERFTGPAPRDEPELRRAAPVGAGGAVPAPRPWSWAPRSGPLLGDTGPWTWAIPDVFAALADPAGFRHRPRYPGTDPKAEPIALWSALLTMCWGVFGWAHPDLGLSRWLASGCPTAESGAQVLNQWWGTDAEAIVHWATSSPTLTQLSATVADRVGAHLPRHQPSRPRGPVAPDWGPLLGGGHDQLHLRHVVDHLVFDPAMVIPPMCEPGGNRAVFLLDEYRGWYKALHMSGDGLPARSDDLEWDVNVVVHSLPSLGRYRRSPVTGRWYSCSHWWHLLGYPL